MRWLDAVIHGILLGGAYALFAAGLSLMFGVMRIVNLAHGALAVVGAYLCSEGIRRLGLPAAVAIVLALPIMAAFGYALQRLLFDRTAKSGEFATPLVTFALSIIIANVLLAAFTSDVRSIPVGDIGTASLDITSTTSVGWVSVIVFVLAVGILGGVQLFLSRTQPGRIIRATADDQSTVRLVGVNNHQVFGAVTAFAVLTATIAGISTGIQSSFDPNSGVTLLLFAFEAVVIGGLGSLWGTLVGGVLLGVSQTVAAEIDPQYALLAGHGVFLVFLLFRPRGLFPGTWQG
ncbi:MAG TPA: branched-chain amino acid ABC transporter permease [Solirubrobacteraceae bacterium]|nr:branched-chain amino acid ABC transporter permease [Solirubrobacteraceae bacterium]